ncbi:amidohydrolase family protein [Agromyces sp. Leaf222]|uniref:N-acyl-D-amino-acid deacylase family protein n=1 Tax=Agromyces sp. Leaf222 TaxID=1735688 RepID=UPI000700D017|nr:amidohydrolase family protein [Agromyces sp. Leaf222]KQM82748.1 N-acyl-D-aspartate/D-glutamate deacylase [Agromyces sp. Leaf222]
MTAPTHVPSHGERGPRVIRDVIVVDGDSGPVAELGEPVDVVVEGERIARVEPRGSTRDADLDTTQVIDGRGRLLLPGFIDAHAHADGLVFDPDVQLALLRQGVTTVIGGQDGVSYAPGDGTYASEYFAAINGPHPGYRGGGIRELLASYDDATAVNQALLVPAGTVRRLVCGRSAEDASRAELDAMLALVAEGLADGAVGLSTGLDYVPGAFATTEELARLAEPVATAGGVYVSHMRGGYESGSATGIDEIRAIAQQSGAAVHVSHFHAEPHLVHGLMAGLAASGVDASFDAYPYTRGCSILAMPLLPASITVRPTAEVLALLSDPVERARLLAEWFPTIVDYPSLGPDWPEMLTLAHVAAPAFGWAHGLTIGAAAARSGTTPAEFALDVLVASRLEVNVVMAVRYARTDADLASILTHPFAMGGSDGIFVGAHPHPRARGSFARYLHSLVVSQGVMNWADAAALVSTRAADRFGLGDRGRVRPGAVADLVLVDPARIADRATYEDPLALAEGIDDVLVAGVPVLAGGRLTGATPGRGIRRSTCPKEA